MQNKKFEIFELEDYFSISANGAQCEYKFGPWPSPCERCRLRKQPCPQPELRIRARKAQNSQTQCSVYPVVHTAQPYRNDMKPLCTTGYICPPALSNRELAQNAEQDLKEASVVMIADEEWFITDEE